MWVGHNRDAGRSDGGCAESATGGGHGQAGIGPNQRRKGGKRIGQSHQPAEEAQMDL